VIEVFRAVYYRQDRDHRLVRNDNDFLGDEFRVVDQARREVETTGGRFMVRSYEGTLADEQRVVWSWYWVAGRPAATPLDAKVAELRGLLEGRRDGIAIALSAPCRLDCEVVEERLADFVSGVAKALTQSPELSGAVP